MPIYIPKSESYGRVHPVYGTLSASTVTNNEDWSGPLVDWIEKPEAPAAPVPDAEAAAVIGEAPFHKSKKAAHADEEK